LKNDAAGFVSLTATGFVGTFDSAQDNTGGASYTRVYGNSLWLAVLGASAALHTGVPIVDFRFLVFHNKNIMGAHLKAHGTADAFFWV